MSTRNLKLVKEIAGYAAFSLDKLDNKMNELYHLLAMFRFDNIEVLETRIRSICGASEYEITSLSLSSYNMGKMDGDSTFAGDSISAYWCNLSGEFYEDRFNEELKRLRHQLSMTINLLDCFKSSLKSFDVIVRKNGEEFAIAEMAILGKNMFYEIQVVKRLVQGIKILMTTYVKHKKKR